MRFLLSMEAQSPRESVVNGMWQPLPRFLWSEGRRQVPDTAGVPSSCYLGTSTSHFLRPQRGVTKKAADSVPPSAPARTKRSATFAETASFLSHTERRELLTLLEKECTPTSTKEEVCLSYQTWRAQSVSRGTEVADAGAGRFTSKQAKDRKV